MAADTEMTIKDVIAALRDSGRDHETYDSVAADLAYLADRGRIARLRRGVYARPDRIVITLTAGSLNSSYINLGDHLGFFPADAVGAANARDGVGAMLTVHFDGRPGPVETDITGAPHKFFRRRAPIKEFFADHDLQPGENIAIEKQSAYEYRVLPVR
jgi:Transcriptional regulator, AbiEi antitoxin